ncbi:glycoside hydrolase family 32 protein [Paenibacillus sp. sptzw28]|nr:glycoside hydrolase family 32 protein [Paenibacillus sp. sptzw28]QYR22737.1 glycoside hydrolase family 32 protein [Paenibacillus sp. sptzw28]
MKEEAYVERQTAHQESINLGNEALAIVNESVAGDLHRLHYHLMPPANWMNDPNGLVYYKGEYHLFYQHYPYSPKWGPMHWGHAKSKDLVHWEHLPIALAPSEWYDKGTLDGHGCWSGSAVDDNGVLTLIYTGHVDDNDIKETQCIARSEDGIHFEKYAGNPVIADSPEKNCFGFRDPKVWKYEDQWYMVVGSGKDGNGKIHLYRSADLKSWTYLGIAAESDGTMGDMWECPDLFPMGGHHALILSPMNVQERNMYLTGEMNYETGKFDYRYKDKLDYGYDFYAAQTLLDGQNRRILMAWMDMWGSKSITEAPSRGWLGAMTIPRELVPGEHGKLFMRPVQEHKLLRNEHYALGSHTIESDQMRITGFRSTSYELEARIEFAAEVKEFGIKLRCSDDGKEETVVTYKVEDRMLQMKRDYEGTRDQHISVAPLECTDGSMKLHIFVDTSSVELFANEGERVITNRVYPSGGSDGLRIFADGGPVKFELEAWTLKNIWVQGEA